MLESQVCGVSFKNPVIAASGTFGFGREYAEILDLSKLGGICSKGLTLEKRNGNKGARIHETPCGIMNSIGMQNPGVLDFLENELSFFESLETVRIANLGGGRIEDMCEGARLLNDTKLDMIELNISCPNVKEGGIAFGIKAKTAEEVVSNVRKCCDKKMIVKLSPNAENISEMAKACEAAGADAVSLVNTFQAMAIDISKKKPVFDNVFAGLSGPAIKPIALRMVYEVAGSVKIPVIGIGGIMNSSDALEFLMAGACLVEVGTANFVNPGAMLSIIDGIREYCEKNGVKSIKELIGAARN